MWQKRISQPLLVKILSVSTPMENNMANSQKELSCYLNQTFHPGEIKHPIQESTPANTQGLLLALHWGINRSWQAWRDYKGSQETRLRYNVWKATSLAAVLSLRPLLFVSFMSTTRIKTKFYWDPEQHCSQYGTCLTNSQPELNPPTTHMFPLSPTRRDPWARSQE